MGRLWWALVLLAVGAGPSVADEKPARVRRMTVVVSETAGIRRFGYPVAAVLQLPEPVKDVEHFRLLENGKPVAAQFRPHGDTSRGIRAVSLDFNVNHAPHEKREYAVEYGLGVEAAPLKGGMRVESADEEFRVIHSADLQFIVPRDLAGLLHSVKTTKTDYLRPGSAGLVFRTADGKEHRPGKPAAGRVARSGQLAAALRFEGAEKLPGGKVASVVEMEFPRSKSWVKLTWAVDDSGGQMAGLGADLNLRVQGEPALVDFGAGTAVYAHLRKGQSAVLRQRGPSWTVLVGPAEKPLPFVEPPGRPGAGPFPKAEGWAHVMDRQRCTAVAVEGFAEGKAGAEIAVDADGRLRLWKHFGKGQEKGKKTLTFWLHFVPMPVQVGAVTSPQAMLTPLQVEVKPQK